MALGDLNLVVSAQVSGATQGLKQVDQSLQRVQGSMARANQATRAMTNQFNSSRSRLQKFATGAMQQAGYQIGDFAVQVANGTSKMQAFGQQGSQLLGIFGPIGAVLGAGVAIFSAFGVAASRSGASIGEFGAALGVLQEPLAAVAGSVKSMAENFSGATQTMLQNIDTALIAAGLFAAHMAGKYVKSMALATASTITFEGVMYSLGVVVARVQMILARFLPFAIMLGMAKMIEMFLQLRKGAGGFGEAIVLLKDLAVEAFSRIGTAFALVPAAIKLGAAEMKLFFMEAINDMLQSLQDFSWDFAQTFNDLFGTDLRGADFDLGFTSESQRRIRDQIHLVNGLSQEYSNLNDELTAPLSSWNALKAAYRAGGREINFLGDAVDDTAGSLSQMANVSDTALSGIDKMFARLDDITNSVSKTMENAMTDAFMSIVDGTQKPIDAFKNMARLIIAELYKVLVVKQLVGSFDTANPSAATGIVGFLGKAFGGFRANGGPVSGGTPYVVGERGPELFVPSRSGTIVPNGAGGGVTVNQNISFGAGVSRAEIQAMLPRIIESTKAAVFDAQRRSVTGRGYA